MSSCRSRLDIVFAGQVPEALREARGLHLWFLNSQQHGGMTRSSRMDCSLKKLIISSAPVSEFSSGEGQLAAKSTWKCLSGFMVHADNHGKPANLGCTTTEKVMRSICTQVWAISCTDHSSALSRAWSCWPHIRFTSWTRSITSCKIKMSMPGTLSACIAQLNLHIIVGLQTCRGVAPMWVPLCISMQSCSRNTIPLAVRDSGWTLVASHIQQFQPVC